MDRAMPVCHLQQGVLRHMGGSQLPVIRICEKMREVKGKTYNWLARFLIGRLAGNMLLLPCNQVGKIQNKDIAENRLRKEVSYGKEILCRKKFEI